jgi:uncharacterized protein YjbI with pentapeptide repeats
MKKLKGIQPLLAIVISLFIPVYPAYLHYDNLTGADFLSSNLSYQNLDEQSPSVDSPNKSKVFTTSFTHFVSLSGANLITQLLHFVPQTSFLQQRTSILRC